MAFKAIGVAAPDQKYALTVAVARADGASDWSCPALERLFSTPADPLRPSGTVGSPQDSDEAAKGGTPTR